MLILVLAAVVLVATVLVVYHHLGYPLLLRYFSRKHREERPPVVERAFRADAGVDRELPTVTLVIPAYNEAGYIAEKVRNLSFIDYPAEKLQIIIACDGCSDDTASIARATLAEPECFGLNLEVREFAQNRGKVAVLNDLLPRISSELTAMSDVSALLSYDALLVAASRLSDKRVGVVTGFYGLHNVDDGEAVYWEYQSRIKQREAKLGSTLGVHGAFYSFRSELFEPMESDTINDDFVLPMRIVERGFRAVYDPNIRAHELEPTTNKQDRTRRRRIAAGNLQQLIRLRGLLHPSQRHTAFMFASGKGLRVLMPYLMLLVLIGSAVLSVFYELPLFDALLAIQLLIYLGALHAHVIGPENAWWPFQAIHYLVQGHVASLLGSLAYLMGQHRGPWQRATVPHEPRAERNDSDRD